MNSLIFLLFFGLVACGDDLYPNPKLPTPDQVIRDAEISASNILLGAAAEKDEKILLTPIIMDEWEVKFTEGKAKLEAEITAIIGDDLWVSDMEKTITVHYGVNESTQWEVQGVDVDDPVIHVIPRSQQTAESF
ncbi:hypothetical protein [Paenibacillus sp. An7]|uniref:hypothetical protein n=1 Tax=Paenibacillus sp. An7 TaxID=2689577 RepID=UPI00135908B1|nr:hypothetical protein [Paenibacillus sp. An7]